MNKHTLIFVGALLMAGMANAATRSATASISVIRPISIASAADLSFGRLQPQGNGNPGTCTISSAPPITRTTNGVSALPGGTETPAIRNISGEAGRAYRVSIPASVVSTQGGYLVAAFTLWTTSKGDITTTRLGQLSASGQDTLRLGATISFPKGSKQDIYTANVPITISYE
jgi:hypothetical protein